MSKNLQRIISTVIFLCAMTVTVAANSAGPECENLDPAIASLISKEDQAALELGRMMLAAKKAIQNPKSPNSINTVTTLGHDQRYYVMTRGWFSYQLQGNLSILEASKERPNDQITDRISFLKKQFRPLTLNKYT